MRNKGGWHHTQKNEHKPQLLTYSRTEGVSQSRGKTLRLKQTIKQQCTNAPSMSPYTNRTTLAVLQPLPPFKNLPYNPTWPEHKGIYCPRPHKKKVKKNEGEKGVTRLGSHPPMALQWLPNYPHNLINYSVVITLGLWCFSCCFYLFCMNLINDSHKSKLY